MNTAFALFPLGRSHLLRGRSKPCAPRDFGLRPNSLSARPILTLGVMLLVMPLSSAAAQQRWQVQQQTRTLAAEMITRVLDVQLRQLQENKLTDLPLYGEIRELRGNVDQLVSSEMQQVVSLLNPQPGSPQLRQRQTQQARQLVRQIVVALLAERHRVRRRLQVSRTNALVRQLIEAEVEIMTTTRSLPSTPAAARPALTLEMLQDQRDVRVVYQQLVDALQDTTTWGGRLAADAAQGLEILEQADVAARLEQAVVTLAQAQFRSAAEHQQAVVDGLRGLLRRLDAARGLDDSARDQAVELVQQLIQQQQRIRTAMGQADLAQQDRQEQLASDQREIDRALQQLAQTLPTSGTLPILVARASRAARTAEVKLFEADQQAALAEQEVVLATLSALEQQLRLANSEQTKSPEQFAVERNALEQLDRDLADLMDLQAEATGQAESDPAAAADSQRRVGQELQQAGERSGLPQAIQRSLNQAQQASGEAQITLQDPTSQAADARKQATERAANALRELAAQVKAALGDSPQGQRDDRSTPRQPNSEGSASNESGAQDDSQQTDPQQAGQSPANAAAGQSTETESTDSRAADSTNDANSRIRQLESEPWFVKLPPAVQQAMRAATRNQPPPGYEERLRRYFGGGW